MFNRKKMIIALSVIFILGFVTGSAVMPFVMHWVAGNPYATNKIAKRVFHTEYLAKFKLTDAQKSQLDILLDKYTAEYKDAREDFTTKRKAFYNGFRDDLKMVLTPDQYESFRKRTDKEMKEREEWHKKMREYEDSEKNKNQK